MFIVGQHVVCINDTWPPEILMWYNQLPEKGGVYTIREIKMGRGNQQLVPPYKYEDEVTVLLGELRNPEFGPEGKKTEGGFRADRFEPLEELTEEEIVKETIKEPVLV